MDENGPVCVRCDGDIATGIGGLTCERRDMPDHCADWTVSVCMGCDEGFYTAFTACRKCRSNTRRCANATTLLCDDGYVLVEGACVAGGSDRFIHNNHTLKCSEGQTPNGETCAQCSDEDCVTCFSSDTCVVCKGRINEDGKCVERVGATVVANNGVVVCDDELVLKNDECVTPSSLVASCTVATAERCLGCDGGVVGSDGSCVQCTALTTGGCECSSNAFFDGVQCSTCGDHCPLCDGGVCMVCDDDYTVVDGRCVAFAHPVVHATAEGIVTRCADGFFTEDGACRECVGCATCFNTTTCLSCGEDDILSGATCESGTEMSKKCKQLIEGNGGCAICRDGFYREDTACDVCPDNCISCAKVGAASVRQTSGSTRRPSSASRTTR